MPDRARSAWTFWLGARGVVNLVGGWLVGIGVVVGIAVRVGVGPAAVAAAFAGVPLALWSLLMPVRVRVFPDGVVEFRSVLRRRRVDVQDLTSAELTLNGWGVRFECRDAVPVWLPFRMGGHGDLMALVRRLNPRLKET